MDKQGDQMIAMVDAETTVEVRSGTASTASPIEVQLGTEPQEVVLAGEVADLQRLVIEADRQVSLFATRGPAPGLTYEGPDDDPDP